VEISKRDPETLEKVRAADYAALKLVQLMGLARSLRTEAGLTISPIEQSR